MGVAVDIRKSVVAMVSQMTSDRLIPSLRSFASMHAQFWSWCIANSLSFALEQKDDCQRCGQRVGKIHLGGVGRLGTRAQSEERGRLPAKGELPRATDVGGSLHVHQLRAAHNHGAHHRLSAEVRTEVFGSRLHRSSEERSEFTRARTIRCVLLRFLGGR